MRGFIGRIGTIGQKVDLDRWRQISKLLEATLDLEADERTSFLTEKCSEDQQLRREVESYLRADEAMGDFIEKPLFCWRRQEAVPPGSRIGAYKIARPIGHGGMGVVYLAERSDDVFEKQVAIKVLRHGIDTEEIIRRFREERQILANLEHANIARILDGGTTEQGLPYFVMEYVEGSPIDRYCHERRLSVREILELFRSVCSAVHMAHQNLIVHRDLKPTNILVTSQGVPKLLDFGIAKILRTGGASLARAEHELSLMTPDYASPEQVLGQPITTASDVYSLGVLLYRLLAGRHPYSLENCERWEIVRIISEVEPMRPSVVVAHGSRGTKKDNFERDLRDIRNRYLKSRSRLLTGDLDQIVLKSTNKEPRHRYASVAEFSEDVRCHIEGFPVSAREGAFAYVAGKFIRRHWLRLATATLLILVIVFAATTVGMWRQADRERRLKNDFVGFLDLLFLYSTSDLTSGEELEALAVLDRVEEKLDELEVELPFQAEILESMSRIYLDRGLYEEARAPLEGALRIRRQLDPRGGPKKARILNNLAGQFLHLREYEKAEELYREALAMKRELTPEEADIAKAISKLATIRLSRREFDAAAELYWMALEIRERIYGPGGPDVATNLRDLGYLFYLQGDFEAAEPLFRQALEIRRTVFGAQDKRVAEVLGDLGRTLHARGRHHNAEELFIECLAIRRRRLGDGHPHVAYTRRDLAALLVDMGELRAAQGLLNQAIAILRQTEEADSWQLAESNSVRGALLAAQGHYVEAEEHLIRGYETLKRTRGEQVLYTRTARCRLRDLYELLDREDELELYQEGCNR